MTSHTSNGLAESQSFDYGILDAETHIVVQQATSDLKGLMRRSAQDVFEIGEKLTKVKLELQHGNFRKWLRFEFGWSVPTARRFMRVYDQFKCFNLNHLNIAASALYYLAESTTPEEARREALERASQGENITYTAARTIVSLYKDQRDDESKQPIIDIRAEVIEDGPFATQLPPTEGHPLNEPEPLVKDSLELTSPIEKSQGRIPKEQSSISTAKFVVGDRICILRRQHGEDNWSGKSAKIWQITPDGWLRVDVEGHKGVRFTLHPDWVKRMIEKPPEQQSQQLEPAIPQTCADEPVPKSLMPLHQTQTDQTTSFEKRVRTTLPLFGKSVYVEGTITHVQIKWHHGSHTGKVQVPVSEVEFLD